MLISPLFVLQSKSKKFALNLNIYRNAHHFTLNTAKKKYKAEMKSQILEIPVITVPIILTYTLFAKTKRLTDISNVLAIHDKFFCDALVEFGRIPDDNFNWIPAVNYRWGGIDKFNPRVEINATEY